METSVSQHPHSSSPLLKSTPIPDARLAADAVLLMFWDTAETAVTIMAASIPTLRILIREVHASRRAKYDFANGIDGPRSAQLRGGTNRSRVLGMAPYMGSGRRTGDGDDGHDGLPRSSSGGGSQSLKPADSRSDTSILQETGTLAATSQRLQGTGVAGRTQSVPGGFYSSRRPGESMEMGHIPV